VDPDEPTPTDPAEARVFGSVISGLQRSYPREKMEEISTSFCFICLLHLANEQGLKLESTVEESAAPVEMEPEQAQSKKVGNIWDLKVRLFPPLRRWFPNDLFQIYRDPNATQSA
jgi:condensin complex subunit 2